MQRAYGVQIMRELSGIGLYRGQPQVLFLLANSGGGMTQAQLSQELSVSPASVTVSLKRMEKAGLIERNPGVRDARCNLVTLTDKGMVLMEEARQLIGRIDERMFRGLGEAEIGCYLELLKRLKENLKE
jgi:DNA-binding MarR family transcriptional regulator